MGSRSRLKKPENGRIADHLTICTLPLDAVPIGQMWYRNPVGVILGVLLDGSSFLGFAPAALPIGTVFKAAFFCRVLPLEKTKSALRFRYYDAKVDLHVSEDVSIDPAVEQVISFPLDVNCIDRVFSGSIELIEGKIVVRACWLEVTVA